MALKGAASIDNANETIGLASSLHPIQNGIIRGEPGTFDVSAAAMLAEQMAR
ncbi:hypothetical protein IFT82_16225 [Sphingomonas sp. CFBP 8760]|nr:hypothetical protein [Sphingomonas sp. CFBP 8760]